jgi:nitrite reductase (cytochrome c-552)
MREKLAKFIAVATGTLIVVAVLLFGVLQQRLAVRVAAGLDPAGWADLYPRHVASFMRTATNYGRTDHGGSEPYDKLEANPFRRRAWAGYAFELEYNAARGHFYMQTDQRDSRRTLEVDQPAGCIHCHAAEAPGLIEAHGWAELSRMRYADVRDQLHVGMSCGDCHVPGTMALRVTRQAFVTALQSQGIDVRTASTREFRTYVCAQCHSEYYFTDAGQELVLSAARGRRVDDIERYFDELGYSDWTHPESGAALLKIQHPEFELHSTGMHSALGVSCTDCHMPSLNAGGLSMSDHWIRSPLTQLGVACSRCHAGPESELGARVVALQDSTTRLLGEVEAALAELIDAIVAARAAGASDAALADARHAHRRAQLRWDFVDAENSTGFHAFREAVRVLTDALALARAGTESARAASPGEFSASAEP